MKKVLLLFAFILTFNTKVFAASPVSLSDFQAGLNDYFGTDYQVNSSMYQNLITDYSRATSKKLVIAINNNYRYVFYLGSSNSQTDLNNVSGEQYVYYSNNSSTDVNNYSLSFPLNSSIYFNSYDDFCAFDLDSTDYENTIYDPLIFTPNFSVNNNLHSGTENIDLSFVQLADNNEYNTDITFYTYVKMYLYTGNDILVDYGKYTVTSYFKSDPIVIYDYSDKHIPTIGAALDLNVYKSSAQGFLEDSLSNVNYNFVSGMSSGTQLNRTTDYVNYVYKGFPHFVNGVEIWVQNFYIDDNKVYVSDWKKWNSKRYSDYDNVVPVSNDQPANGIITTESDTSGSQPDNNDTYNPIGVDTGASSSGVVINNFTPNYPDYPTAVSYNHDNLLVQFIQTAAYLPDMFSGYSSFLTEAFGFIPPQIWTIIGMGFLGCIAVMIVKVL